VFSFIWSINNSLNSLKIVIQIFESIFHLRVMLVLQRP
jgi:hypothetical protein